MLRVREVVLPCALAVLLSGIVVVLGYRLSVERLRLPLHYGDDGLLILPLVKATIERGSHWRNERLGAPGIQETHDFPVVDHFHFAMIWLLGQCIPDVVVVFNVYYLLGYPLAALTATLVLWRLGVSQWVAAMCGLLYAFQPYHTLRFQSHYFLSAYYLVPFALLYAVEIGMGKLPFFRKERGWQAPIVAIVVAAVTASGGAYYAFFASGLLFVGGLSGWVNTGRFRAFAAALVMVGTIFLVGLLNHAPAIAYSFSNGHNTSVHERRAVEAENYGLRLIELFLPPYEHKLASFRNVRDTYYSTDRERSIMQNESNSSSFGIAGAVGLFLLLATCVCGLHRDRMLRVTAGLALAAFLIGTVSGIGAAFAVMISAQVRAYNRISIFLAFLALLAVARWLDWLLTGRRRIVRVLALVALTGIGMYDQTPRSWFPTGPEGDYDQTEYRRDARYYAEMEAQLPEGMVMTLPYTEWPETNYDHVRGYLHTKRLRFSYGAMKGRDADYWLRELAEGPVDDLVERAVFRGFEGIHFNGNILEPRKIGPMSDALQKALGADAPVLVHADGKQHFFDLRPYRERLRQTLGDALFAAATKRERERISVLFLDGFQNDSPNERPRKSHFVRPTTRMTIVNPSDRERAIRLVFQVGNAGSDAATLTCAYGKSDVDKHAVPKSGCKIGQTFHVPPGKLWVTFRAEPETERFSIFDLQIVEPDEPLP